MRFAAALSLFAILAQDQDTGEQFYRFKAGTSWTFQQAELKTEIAVTKEEDGKVYLEQKVFQGKDAKPVVETLAWYVDNGLLVWAEQKDGKLLPSFSPYKLGSKKGDTWAASDALRATHMGTMEVTVPAGTYKDAVHIRIVAAADEKQAFSIYFAAGVGFVRVDADGARMELVEFKEAK